MPTYRIGIGSEFNLKDRKVGIGSESPIGDLDVAGIIKSGNLYSSGISTLTTYSGFSALNKDKTSTTFDRNCSTESNIVVGVGETFIVSAGATVNVGSISDVKVGNTFGFPVGDTDDRPEVPVEGTVRFNRDLNTLEFYNGVEWRQFTVNGASGRGVIFGGEQKGGALSAGFNDFVNIMSLGNARSFGDLSTGARTRLETAGASSTRGIWGCGRTPSNTDIIDYITIASEGKAIDFGNAQQTAIIQNNGTKSSSTRGVFGGGTPTELQYVEVSTLGNSLSFGDLSQSSGGNQGSSNSSPTRAVFATGTTDSKIEAINFCNTGASEAFGSCQESKTNSAGGGNNVRGIFAGAYKSGDLKTDLIEFITMSSLGNTTNFGDLSVNRACLNGCSTNTRAIFTGGYYTTTSTATGGTGDNRIEYITIATTGNAADFGDTTSGQHHARGASLSDSHGGLGGY